MAILFGPVQGNDLIVIQLQIVKLHQYPTKKIKYEDVTKIETPGLPKPYPNHI